MLSVNNIKFYNPYRKQINSFNFRGKVTKPSDKLQVVPEDLYFIRMENYFEDKDWAQDMNNATYILSDMIRNNEDFDAIWEKTRSMLRRINHNISFCEIRNNGLGGYFMHFDAMRGSEYYLKYKEKLMKQNGSILPKGNDENSNLLTCNISGNALNMFISYGSKSCEDYFLLKSIVNEEYKKLKAIPNPSDFEINCHVAKIHWLIAQATPFKKGSDSFANLLTKAIYHSYGMRLSPAKSGVSFDFEAFYSDLDEYIKKYPKLFEKQPKRR